MLIEAFLVAIWAGICSLDDVGPQMLRRPLLTGTVAGIIMGDTVQGLAIAATLELMWMGIGNVGAYSAPDIIAGSIIGVALGISSKGGIAAGIALAVPVSILCQQLLIIWRSFASFLNVWAEKSIQEGDYGKLLKVHYFSTPLWFLIRAVPCFLAVYFGGGSDSGRHPGKYSDRYGRCRQNDPGHRRLYPPLNAAERPDVVLLPAWLHAHHLSEAADHSHYLYRSGFCRAL